MAMPTTWAEALERLAYVFGGHSDVARATAEDWIREAVLVVYGQESLHDVPRVRRQVAFQKTCGTLTWLEEQGEIAFAVGLRAIVADAFARYWGGAALNGPPWRLDAFEDLPTYQEWVQSATFDGAAV